MPRLPLVVNTHGWVKGLGQALLQRIHALVRPAWLLQMRAGAVGAAGAAGAVGALADVHMDYLEAPRASPADPPAITFLYRMVPGTALPPRRRVQTIARVFASLALPRFFPPLRLLLLDLVLLLLRAPLRPPWD